LGLRSLSLKKWGIDKKSKMISPELYVAMVSTLMINNRLKYKDVVRYIKDCKDWWIKSKLVPYINKEYFGSPSYKKLLEICLKERSTDVALVATERYVSEDYEVDKTGMTSINKLSQIILKKEGKIRRIKSDHCTVNTIITEVLGSDLSVINWKDMLKTHYKQMLRTINRWHSYINSDPTAWVNITDTMNDMILDDLFKKDSSIGNYVLGNIGGNLDKNSKFAKKYKQMYSVCSFLHNMRLESDLSHSRVRKTGKRTRYILHKEIKSMKLMLKNGYLEMWSISPK
jgi:hypothetical protein